MKKRTLKEELERIHSITYGKKVLLEDDLLTKLIQGGDTNAIKPIDVPSKADFVDDDVRKFLTDLKSIKEPVTEQKLGSMQHQKEVETIQIGLVLLGYELPRHGVDGLFGPETADAVKKYKTDNNIISEGFISGIDEMVWNKMPWGIDAGNKVDGINCFKSVKKQHLSPSRSKNFPKKSSKIDCYNYLDKPKEIVKARKTSTPSEKVTTGAAIILNPIGAAFWLIDKVVSTGVDKTINK